MANAPVKKIKVSEQSVREMAHALAATLSPPGDLGEHPTELEMICYQTQALSAEAVQRTAAHLRLCPDCAAEMERLQTLSPFWQDENFLQRLEAKVRRLSQTRARIAPFAGVRAAFGTSLRALVMHQFAFGEGKEAESASIEFPIVDQGQTVEGMRGIVTRKNREYSLFVKITDEKYRPQFQDAGVLVTIFAPQEGRPLLQRKVDIEVAVLIGTDLTGVEELELTAQLWPAAQPVPTGEDS